MKNQMLRNVIAYLLYVLWILLLTLPRVNMIAPETRFKRQTTCNPPKAETGSLVADSEGYFPEDEFKKAEAKLSKVMKEYIKEKNEAIENYQELESTSISQDPACLYDAICKTTRQMVTKQKILSNIGENCWIIENVLIAQCDSGFAHDFACAKWDVPDNVGSGCFPYYRNLNVMAFCKGSTNEIKPVAITIATSCQAQIYDCSPE